MNIIKITLAEKGLSVAKASELTGVDKTTLTLLSNSRRKAQLRTLIKISKGLEIPLDPLLFLLDDTASERGMLGVAARQKNKE
jgi:transcriptional regulator with XRE-family HTH domain